MSKKAESQPSPVTRRAFLKTASGATAAAALAGPFPASVNVARAQSRPIKVGIVSAYSGVFSVVGKRSELAIRLAFEKSKYRDRVKFFIEDSQVKPDVAVQKAQRLVEREGVDVLVGPVAGHEGLAVSEYCKTKKKLMLLVYGGNVKIAGENCSRYTFMVGHTIWSVSAPVVPWVLETLGKDVFLIGSDYITGRDIVRWMDEGIKKGGGRIVGTTFPPLGNSEFAPYIAQIKNASPRPKVVTGFVGGSDLVALAKQFDEFGLKRDGIVMVQTIGGFSDVQARAMGEAGVGHYDIIHYSHWLTHKENQDFVADFKKFAPEELVDDAHAIGHDVGTCIVHGLDAAGGVPDNEKMIDAIGKRRWVGPRGECSFGPNHVIKHPLNIRQIQKVGNEYRSIPIKNLGAMGTPWDASGPGGACKL
ncbi:MAG: ABC transporter substrate-binding protein [Candidatus Rokubacteria bacterium]|nr:ABC transporter substrate-binding protein [Candidatus Rokubacteria bacterium]